MMTAGLLLREAGHGEGALEVAKYIGNLRFNSVIQLVPLLNQQGNYLAKLHARPPLCHSRSALL